MAYHFLGTPTSSTTSGTDVGSVAATGSTGPGATFRHAHAASSVADASAAGLDDLLLNYSKPLPPAQAQDFLACLDSVEHHGLRPAGDRVAQALAHGRQSVREVSSQLGAGKGIDQLDGVLLLTIRGPGRVEKLVLVPYDDGWHSHDLGNPGAPPVKRKPSELMKELGHGVDDGHGGMQPYDVKVWALTWPGETVDAAALYPATFGHRPLDYLRQQWRRLVG